MVSEENDCGGGRERRSVVGVWMSLYNGGEGVKMIYALELESTRGSLAAENIATGRHEPDSGWLRSRHVSRMEMD
jgi:hypothetical protein